MVTTPTRTALGSVALRVACGGTQISSSLARRLSTSAMRDGRLRPSERAVIEDFVRAHGARLEPGAATVLGALLEAPSDRVRVLIDDVKSLAHALELHRELAGRPLGASITAAIREQTRALEKRVNEPPMARYVRSASSTVGSDLPATLFDDRTFWRALARMSGEHREFPPDIAEDAEVLLAMAQANSGILPRTTIVDAAVLKAAVKHNRAYVKLATPALLEDRQLVLELLAINKAVFHHLDARWRSDRDVLVHALAGRLVSPDDHRDLLEDRDFCLALVALSGSMARELPAAKDGSMRCRRSCPKTSRKVDTSSTL